jgi:hypothetical protein
MTGVRRMAAVVVTLVAAALATTAQGEARAASDGGSNGAADVRADRALAATRLHIHVTGCNRCALTLQHAVSGAQKVWTSKPQRIGPDEVANFRLLTSRTHGLSFVLHAPWEGNTGAVPNIVTRYRGQKVDNGVTVAEARQGTHAEGCWAGTSIDSVPLSFHVARVRAKTLDGQPTQIPLAYATHTMSSWRPMVKTFKGTIGNQDAFYCTRPPRTDVSFTAPACAGCELQLLNGAIRPENLWISPSKQVEADVVSFRVPRDLTRGLSVTVHAPWEGSPPFTTLVVWRYGGHQAGDPVVFADARTRTRASGCWAGTGDPAVTVALTIRRVTVAGNTGPTDGSIAFADVTQPWLTPMSEVTKGVLGAQEAVVCDK